MSQVDPLIAARTMRRRLLESPICFDTTIPLVFASYGLEGALAAAFADRGCLPWSVLGELRGLANEGGMAAARRLIEPAPLLRVVWADKDLHVQTWKLQQELKGLRRKPIRPDRPEPSDEGEAAAIAVCLRNAAAGMGLAAQDGPALRCAVAHRVAVMPAVQVLMAMVLTRQITLPDAWAAYVAMVPEGMGNHQFFPDEGGRTGFANVIAAVDRVG